eukprot:GHVR01096241.1.p1 GENE.GHVR01096241.1~~GHVR01096241.1.p1  ORF type:complete len:592 (+),score=113.13 GHVR01096241.1:136-1911(+)
MGISFLYRYILGRYPKVSYRVTEDIVPSHDYLYLDVNAILHNCIRYSDSRIKDTAEVVIIETAFKCISKLVTVVKPKKLLYLAVDGVAPRAKMDLQRSRRFKVANELKRNGYEYEFNRNSISPGTEFVYKFNDQIQSYISLKIKTDPLWQSIDVVFNGFQVPGEGEHKIIDFIRKQKSQPSYKSDTTHCVYSMDADVVILSLVSHEPFLSLINEDSNKRDAQSLIDASTFRVCNVGVLREEMIEDLTVLNDKFEFDGERVIDDFVLMCFLCGNDFLPSVWSVDHNLHDVVVAYKKMLREWTKDTAPWLCGDCGVIRWDCLHALLVELAPNEKKLVLREAEERGYYDGDDDSAFEDFIMQHYESYEVVSSIRDVESVGKIEALVCHYLEGLQWTLYYYYRGPMSWSYHYPYLCSPIIKCMLAYTPLVTSTLKIQFNIGDPLLPLEQLFAVIPPCDSYLLPTSYQAWALGEGCFLDTHPSVEVLLAELRSHEHITKLSEDEHNRNTVGNPQVFRYAGANDNTDVSTLQNSIISGDSVCVCEFHHPCLPPGVSYFPNRPMILEGEVPQGFEKRTHVCNFNKNNNNNNRRRRNNR